MSQIVITGTPPFEDLKVLVDMLPESDRVALKQYLQGLGAKIVDLWKIKKYVLLLSYELLDEIAEVLLNPKLMLKYNYSFEDVESLIILCKKQAIIIKPALIIQICRDPDDDKIINCEW